MGVEFFDDIIVISLAHRIDRRMLMQEQMDKAGIKFRFFDAIQDENGVKGLVESMKKVLRECLQKKMERVLILEDDAQFLVDNPVGFFEEVIPQLPQKWNCFYLGLNLLSVPKRMSTNILKVVDCYSTHSLAYSKAGMEAVLEFLEVVPVKPYDQFLRDYILPMAGSYCTFPMMMTQRLTYSDIEKKEVDWGKLMAMTFAQMTRNI